MMKRYDEACMVTIHEAVGIGYRLIEFKAPLIAQAAQAGQFVHVRVPSLEPTALRRPFSIYDADPTAGTITLLYKLVGRGTAMLAPVKVGEMVQIEGPLGNGFPETCKGVPLLVGGGYGVAPLYLLAKRLLAHGSKPILFVGGRTKDDLLALSAFAALGIETRIATNDGSAGVKGFAVDPLDDELIALREAKKSFELFTCGPDGLLKAVAMRATGTGAKGWISMDRHMVCGVGACFACVQKLKRGDGTIWNARCCVNGPVFAASDIVWG